MRCARRWKMASLTRSAGAGTRHFRQKIAEDAPETFAGTEKAVQGWVDCFLRCALVGTVFAGGVNGVGEIVGHIALEQAYQMGKEV